MTHSRGHTRAQSRSRRLVFLCCSNVTVQCCRHAYCLLFIYNPSPSGD